MEPENEGVFEECILDEDITVHTQPRLHLCSICRSNQHDRRFHGSAFPRKRKPRYIKKGQPGYRRPVSTYKKRKTVSCTQIESFYLPDEISTSRNVTSSTPIRSQYVITSLGVQNLEPQSVVDNPTQLAVTEAKMSALKALGITAENSPEITHILVVEFETMEDSAKHDVKFITTLQTPVVYNLSADPDDKVTIRWTFFIQRYRELYFTTKSRFATEYVFNFSKIQLAQLEKEEGIKFQYTFLTPLEK